jgi:ferredoxin
MVGGEKMTKIINKSDLSKLASALNDYELYGPVMNEKNVRYQKVESPDAMILDFFNSQKPPKELFFPQTETLFNFIKDGNRFVDVEEPELMSHNAALFGIRPCDALSLNMLDKLFSWDYKDKYYIARREHFTLIGLACTGEMTPTPNCFCTSVGGDPASTDGLDMLWTDIGDSYHVESLTEKGQALLDAAGSVFTDASDSKKKASDDAKDNGRTKVTRKLEVDGIKEALQGTFDHPYWDEFARRCIGCGTCTLLCPTCHCFDINDVVTRGEGHRERTWDSCQYEYYTLHASGHNPRPAKKHRQRNRMYHKFWYMDENLDVTGCVGCGRCIWMCPVNIDIIEVLEGAKEVPKDVC